MVSTYQPSHLLAPPGYKCQTSGVQIIQELGDRHPEDSIRMTREALEFIEFSSSGLLRVHSLQGPAGKEEAVFLVNRK